MTLNGLYAREMHVLPVGNGSCARKSDRDLRKNAHPAQVGKSLVRGPGFVATPCGRRRWSERPREIGPYQFDGASVGRLRGAFCKSLRRREKEPIKLIPARCAIFLPYSLYGYSLEREISAFGCHQCDDRNRTIVARGIRAGDNCRATRVLRRDCCPRRAFDDGVSWRPPSSGRLSRHPSPGARRGQRPVPVVRLTAPWRPVLRLSQPRRLRAARPGPVWV